MIHTISMYTDYEHYKMGVMSDETLSDMKKLKLVFDVSKEKLKATDTQLYYAILAVLDQAKSRKEL